MVVNYFWGGKRLMIAGRVAHNDVCCCDGPPPGSTSCDIINVDGGTTSRAVQLASLVTINVGAFTNGDFTSFVTPPKSCDDNGGGVPCTDIDGEHELTQTGGSPCAWGYAFGFCGSNDAVLEGRSSYSLTYRTNDAGDVWWWAQIRLNFKGLSNWFTTYVYESSPVGLVGGVYQTNGSISLTLTSSTTGGMELCFVPGSISGSAS